MNIDKRILYVIIAIFAIRRLSWIITDQTSLLVLVISLPVVLIAITCHEFAHAFAADKLGDDTPRLQGRLSLNPLSHLDPIGTVLLIFAGFGWGKPVQIQPRNFNRNIKMTTGEIIVAAAGPLTNIVLAFISAIAFTAIYRFAPEFADGNVGGVLLQFLEAGVIVNVGLGIFNLIPLPPLDGSKILAGFLPYETRNWFERNYYIFYIIFIAIWITGIAGEIISPIISWVGNGMIDLAGALFGVKFM